MRIPGQPKPTPREQATPAPLNPPPVQPGAGGGGSADQLPQAPPAFDPMGKPGSVGNRNRMTDIAMAKQTGRAGIQQPVGGNLGAMATAMGAANQTGQGLTSDAQVSAATSVPGLDQSVVANIPGPEQAAPEDDFYAQRQKDMEALINRYAAGQGRRADLMAGQMGVSAAGGTAAGLQGGAFGNTMRYASGQQEKLSDLMYGERQGNKQRQHELDLEGARAGDTSGDDAGGGPTNDDLLTDINSVPGGQGSVDNLNAVFNGIPGMTEEQKGAMYRYVQDYVNRSGGQPASVTVLRDHLMKLNSENNWGLDFGGVVNAGAGSVTEGVSDTFSLPGILGF